MLTRKKCPKCGGNIYSGNDYYGKYEQCLQCGYTCDLDLAGDRQKLADELKEKTLPV
jgi:acetyl-CoA carboxylase beta subunit